MSDGFVMLDAIEKKVAPHPINKKKELKAWGLVLAFALVWLAVWQSLLPIANWLAFDLLKLAPHSHFGEAVAFFLYDVPKIMLLLTGMIFIVSTARSFFSTEKTRRLLGGKRQGVGNVVAASLGVVTPFCSCSAVPLFIGFIESGIPLGVTFSFLIATPMVNEIALVLLFGLFGWKIAAIYLVTGLAIAVVAGIVIGLIPNVEDGVEDFVWEIVMQEQTLDSQKLSWHDRFSQAWQGTLDIVKKVWLYVIVGIAIGAAIHGYVPQNALATILGKDTWWSVPAAVILGIPMYSNAAGVIPVVSALMEKGASLGPVLAFMMSVVALSLPEMIILRRVLKPRLIGIFIGVVGIGIITVGYLFNFII